MKGKHKIEVRSGRVVFTIELERNITILRGDSATGKTTLVEMLQAYETYGRQSGVTVSCDKPCRVLSGVNWELQLNATHDSIVFVDEGSTLKVLVIADGAAFGPQMNDIYAYDPDTEEEAGQCMDEVIQIAEESGAEIQFY